jgi:periplasmic nitrate reductase NapE
MSAEDPKQRRREELRSWLFLTAIMAPVLAVLIVSGYGFIVWMLQATQIL